LCNPWAEHDRGCTTAGQQLLQATVGMHRIESDVRRTRLADPESSGDETGGAIHAQGDEVPVGHSHQA
jgi:hypothetical protein